MVVLTRPYWVVCRIDANRFKFSLPLCQSLRERGNKSSTGMSLNTEAELARAATQNRARSAGAVYSCRMTYVVVFAVISITPGPGILPHSYLSACHSPDNC